MAASWRARLTDIESLSLLACTLSLLLTTCLGQAVVETITFTDDEGVEHEEYAFAEPRSGLPTEMLDIFCASIKTRLYWKVFRAEVKSSMNRKQLYLRRAARLARHIFADAREADKPFDAPMLSQPDQWLKAPYADSDQVDKAIDKLGSQTDSASNDDSGEDITDKRKLFDKIKGKVSGVKKTLGSSSSSLGSKQFDELESSDTVRELELQGQIQVKSKIKSFLKYWGPKVAIGLYTRFTTMWWLMMSCLFAKIYLWDPALDEYMKLQRSLVMWPELLVTKMHELNCKPLNLFRRILDTCKILNPLMHADLGQFSLDKLTRFKSDQ